MRAGFFRCGKAARPDVAAFWFQSLSHFRLLGRCVSAEPAAVFAAGLAFLWRSTFDAAVPALFPVCSFFAIGFPRVVAYC